MLAAVVSGGFTLLRGAVGLATATAVRATPLPSHVAMPVLCRARPRHQRWSNGNLLGPSAGFISHLAADTASATRVLRAFTTSTIAPHGGAEEDFNRSTPPPSTTNNNESQQAKARREARFDEEGEYRVFRELLEGKKTRFVSRVMYDGTNYKGFQLQGNGLPTVQVPIPDTARSAFLELQKCDVATDALIRLRLSSGNMVGFGVALGSPAHKCS